MMTLVINMMMTLMISDNGAGDEVIERLVISDHHFGCNYVNNYNQGDDSECDPRLRSR